MESLRLSPNLSLISVTNKPSSSNSRAASNFVVRNAISMEEKKNKGSLSLTKSEEIFEAAKVPFFLINNIIELGFRFSKWVLFDLMN